MNYNQAVDYIHSLMRFGSKLGLERIKDLLTRLGNPEKQLEFIHIAGTNGKGSTANLSAKILQNSGYKVGLYTSPFIVDFKERFQINSQMISESKLTELTQTVKQQIDIMNENGDEVTEFEAVTALAMLYFATENCDIVCLEVGLGGRFDATNVIDTPLVSVITSVSLDHTNILGDTVEEIAFEKAGIIKPNGTTVTYPLLDEDALGVIMEKCAKENNRLVTPNKNAVETLKMDITGSKFRYGDTDYCLSLIGEHQIYNAMTAIEVMNVLKQKGFSISDESIKRGLVETKFPARFEILKNTPLTVLDGAHNPDGTKMLKKALVDTKCKNIIAIVAMMEDKHYSDALGEVLPLCDTVIAVKASNPRSLSAEELAQTAKQYCEDVLVADDLNFAVQKGRELVAEDGMLLIFGSLYLAGDIREIASK